MGNRATPPPSSGPDGGGVRIVDKPHVARSGVRAWIVLVAIAALLGTAWWLMASPPGPSPGGSDAMAMQPESDDYDGAQSADASSQPSARARATPVSQPLPRDEPDDLASYFKPGDPEPTGAEVIEAMHDAGIRTGIGAFNPPGTSPPLVGLAVPKDFVLPPGYVRHHQVTDEGVDLEPILMFAPDFVLRDRDGRARAMPANRVVPPELAPPGMPLRRIRVPATP